MNSTLARATVIIAFGAVVFVLFDRFGPYQSGRGLRPRPIETVSGGVVELRRTFDGHYYLNGAINGHPVVFMVDTGASTVSVGAALAEQLDLGACRPVNYRTAGGSVRGCEARAREVEAAGARLFDQRVAVLPDQRKDLVLLGMSVLKHFRIETEGATMRLTPTVP